MGDMPDAARPPHNGPAQSMSLLVDLSTHSLDAGYGEAARRRSTAGEAGGATPRRTRPVLLAMFLVVGLLLATAAAQQHRRAPAAAQLKKQLTAEVARRTAATDAQQRQLTALRQQVVAERDTALAASRSGRQLAASTGALELATGGVPVHGPGLRVRVDDAPPPDT